MKNILILKVSGIADLRQYIAAIGEFLQGISLFIVPADSQVQLNGDVPDGVVVLKHEEEGREWRIIQVGNTCRFEKPPVTVPIVHLYRPAFSTIIKLLERLNSEDEEKISGVYLENSLPGIAGSIASALVKFGPQPKQP